MSVLFETPRSAEPPISIGRCGASALITSPLATRVAIGFGIFKIRQVRFPIRRQFASHRRAPLLAQLGMLLLVLLNQRIPFGFLLRAALDRFAKMRQRLIGNVELLVFGPAEMPLRFAHRLFAGRIAVGFARARRSACRNRSSSSPKSSEGLSPTDCASRIAASIASRSLPSSTVERVPAISFKTLRHVFAESEIGKAFDRHVVVVVEIDQFAEFQMAGERRRFRSHAFHQIAVGNNCVDVMIDQRKIFLY